MYQNQSLLYHAVPYDDSVHSLELNQDPLSIFSGYSNHPNTVTPHTYAANNIVSCPNCQDINFMLFCHDMENVNVNEPTSQEPTLESPNADNANFLTDVVFVPGNYDTIQEKETLG